MLTYSMVSLGALWLESCSDVIEGTIIAMCISIIIRLQRQIRYYISILFVTTDKDRYGFLTYPNPTLTSYKISSLYFRSQEIDLFDRKKFR